jgi:MoaA/NifB/PqqE/SkfB family radical SAM enzyme
VELTLLYRGPLASCNYACAYCPFAKQTDTPEEHRADARALTRFVDWVAGRHEDRMGIFFTPWGEALIHRRYQEAIVRLSHMPHVARVTIQTNLSGPLDWVTRCDRTRFALWTTYHPPQVTRERFLAQCRRLDRAGVRYSVGIVGMREHLAEAEALRRALPPHRYLWVNAYKHGADYYTAAHLRRYTAIDPLFPINNRRHPSRGRACRCGHTVLSVDGAGTVRRCHFIREPLGNLYTPGFEAALRPTPCTNATCGCHIGYVHMPHLGLDAVFGDGLLERIPAAYR